MKSDEIMTRALKKKASFNTNVRFTSVRVSHSSNVGILQQLSSAVSTFILQLITSAGDFTDEFPLFKGVIMESLV